MEIKQFLNQLRKLRRLTYWQSNCIEAITERLINHRDTDIVFFMVEEDVYLGMDSLLAEWLGKEFGISSVYEEDSKRFIFNF